MVTSGIADASFNSPDNLTFNYGSSCLSNLFAAFFITNIVSDTKFQYVQPGNPPPATSAGASAQARIATFAEAYLSAGVDSGSYKISTQQAEQSFVSINNYQENGQLCKYGNSGLVIMGTGSPYINSGGATQGCAASADWVPYFIAGYGLSNISRFGSLTTSGLGSDTVAVNGVGASSYCSLTPKNPQAAANIAGTYVSQIANGVITVVHNQVPGMIYDIQCTPG